MVLANKNSDRKNGQFELMLLAAAAAVLVALGLPFLSGSNHTCPVLNAREKGGGSSARAVPAFARKYNVDCTYCHTAWPQLNRTGLEFRYLGYRMPYEVPKIPRAQKPTATPPATASLPSEPAKGAKTAPTPAMIDDGKIIATEMQCMGCHVGGGNIINANKPIKGSAFLKKYPDDAQIASIIRHGLSGTAMPAYSIDRLSDEQLEKLIAYIRSLTPTP